jgi:hypothetical protein
MVTIQSPCSVPGPIPNRFSRSQSRLLIAFIYSVQQWRKIAETGRSSLASIRFNGTPVFRVDMSHVNQNRFLVNFFFRLRIRFVSGTHVSHDDARLVFGGYAPFKPRNRGLGPQARSADRRSPRS